MAKLPAFQFYPGDWRKDMGVQSLSFHDRGVWWEMLCLMHESERRGVLVLNGAAMNEDALSRLLGLDKQILTTTLTTLLTSGVASREEGTGAIYSRRMVRDENLRKIRAEAGSKGGNPVLLNQKPTTPDKQIPTPSSSVSSSKHSPSGANGGFMAAYDLAGQIGMAVTANDVHVLGQVVEIAAEQAKCDLGEAVKFLVQSAKDAEKNGEVVNVFWFKDRKFINGGQNGENHKSPSSQRIHDNRLSLAKAAIKRGWIRPDQFAGGGAEEMAEPRPASDDGGISGGLRSVDPEILPPGSPRGNGRVTD